MGLKDLYRSGLGVPGYSRRKLGKVFIGAESGALVTTQGKFDFRKTAQVQAAAIITKERPFAMVAFPANTVVPAVGSFATLAELDKAFGDAGDHPADFAYVAAFDSSDTRPGNKFPEPAQEFGSFVLTIPVRAAPDPVSEVKTDFKVKAAIGVGAAVALIALAAKH